MVAYINATLSQPTFIVICAPLLVQLWYFDTKVNNLIILF